MPTTNERFLVTGALGCIGAWTLRQLARDGLDVVGADLGGEPTRPRLILSDAELARVRFTTLDVTDLAALRALLERESITHVVHLAGLQIPHCAANPPLGARVNVEGTVNMLEAVRQSGGHVRGLAYASSIAVLGPSSMYPSGALPDDAPQRPSTLYGVYKQADEGAARLYWESWGVPSIGLRPAIVYGVGRDQGRTSDATKALLAAVRREPFQFGFGGEIDLQYAPDVAAAFIASARAQPTGAGVYNLHGSVASVAELVGVIDDALPGSAELLNYPESESLGIATQLSDAGLLGVVGKLPKTALADGVRETLARFGELVKAELL
jgi:nucleoside-diphosphate-sugar epimerase